MDSICYVYGVVPPTFADQSGPKGLDALPVERIDDAGLTALVSLIDAQEYSSDKLESRSGDVDWVAPRAVAHDKVVTWASDAGPVIPFPMWTLFSNAAAVREMLRERSAEFGETLRSVDGAHEYAVRVFASPASVLEQISELRPAIGELEEAAAKATPGQRYLIQRKIAEQRDNEVRAYLRETAQTCFDQLQKESIQSLRHALPVETPAGKGRAILYAAFLVRDDSMNSFRKILTDLVTGHKRSGLQFDFTGPWPPYNFVGTRSVG